MRPPRGSPALQSRCCRSAGQRPLRGRDCRRAGVRRTTSSVRRGHACRDDCSFAARRGQGCLGALRPQPARRSCAASRFGRKGGRSTGAKIHKELFASPAASKARMSWRPRSESGTSMVALRLSRQSRYICLTRLVRRPAFLIKESAIRNGRVQRTPQANGHPFHDRNFPDVKKVGSAYSGGPTPSSSSKWLQTKLGA